MGRWKALTAAAAIAVCLGLAWPAAASPDKAGTLDAMLSAIGSRRELLVQRIELAESKRAALMRERAALAQELRQEIHRAEAAGASAATAGRGRRVDYDLRLLQHVTAVVEALERRIESLRTAVDVLDFYARKIGEERSYLRTVSGRDIARLSTEVMAILEEHDRQLRQPLVVAAELSRRSLEAVRLEALGADKRPRG